MKHILRTFALLVAATMGLASCGDKDNELFTIIVSSNNPEWGQVYGGGKYEEGTEIQIAASPLAGYRFVRWNDNSTDNPRTLTVKGDAAYVAFFEDINNTGGGDTGGGTEPQRDTIPHDSASHVWVTLGDTTWAGLAVVKQLGTGYHQITITSDESGEGPSLSFTFPGTAGVHTSGSSPILSVYYMEHGFTDLVEVNGQQYPRWLAVGDFTVDVIEYNLNEGYISCNIDADMLNMEREGQGLSEEYRTLRVEMEKMYFIDYGGGN